ncbi:MAG: hypothetical protein HPM95_06440 [Alphaproteobacteria bacterium]|nr:hypothetical protein [Alphaproteobacteria bacterium]
MLPPHATKEPDGLLRIANAHPGPVMYAVDEQKAGPVVVSFDNSYDIWRAMDLALVEGLWSMSELRIVGFVDDDIRAEIERRAERGGRSGCLRRRGCRAARVGRSSRRMSRGMRSR